MRGGPIGLIKARRTGPESVEHGEGFIAGFGKAFMGLANCGRPFNRLKLE
jgi:hypothetical protein